MICACYPVISKAFAFFTKVRQRLLQCDRIISMILGEIGLISNSHIEGSSLLPRYRPVVTHKHDFKFTRYFIERLDKEVRKNISIAHS